MQTIAGYDQDRMHQPPHDMQSEQKIKLHLAEHPSIEDCVVVKRQLTEVGAEFVAYVVCNGHFSEMRLRSHLEKSLSDNLPIIHFVPISNVPLTPQGAVDTAALLQIPVVDAALAANWEERVRSLPGIQKVAVTVQDATQPIPPLHIADLLPSTWRQPQTDTTEVKAPSDVTSATTQTETAPKPLALSVGELLPVEPDMPTNLAQVLQRAATQLTTGGVTYLQADSSENSQSYAELLEAAERVLAGLRQQGLSPQDKVIFQVEGNQSFIPAFWGCFLGGFVPVPIAAAPSYEASNSVVKKLLNAWERLGKPLILTTKAQLTGLQRLAQELNLEGFKAVALEEIWQAEGDRTHHVSQPEDLALLLLTSGSTGVPKGVTLTHHNLVNSIRGTAYQSDFNADDIFLNWLPLDHPGPIIRCVIRPVFLGALQIHAPTSAVLADPLKWFDWIEKYRVTSAWAPNFAYALVGDRAEAIKQRKWDLSCLRSCLSTAEPIAPKTSRRFLELLAPFGLQPTAMHASWGMAETSSGVTSCETYLVETDSPFGDSFANLGTPIPGVSLRIVDDQNQLVPEETIGFLQVKGVTVTPGYYQNPEMNQEVFTEDGWFKTGDLGFLRHGALTITGRSKDVIIINGSNYYTHEIEAVVEEVAGVEVSYTAACATRSAGSDTDQLVVFFNTEISDDEPLTQLLKEIQKTVVRKVGISPTYLLPVEKSVIPKTSIGKIQRSQLKQQFDAGEFSDLVKRIDILLRNENTLPDWFYRKVWCRRQPDGVESCADTGSALIFKDQLGFADALIAQLDERQQPWVTVEVGQAYAQISEQSFQIDPAQPEHYQKLLSAIAHPVSTIFHCWTYAAYAGEVANLAQLQQAQDLGVYSLLFLAQALNQLDPTETIRLAVVSSHVQSVDLGAEIAYEKAPLLGLIKTLPRELPWLDCCHMDFVAGAATPHVVLREVSQPEREREVAYRNGDRFILRLEPANLLEQPTQPLPFKQGGMYLLSGGLGGIGTEIARYLLQTYQARLLLLGRTPLPERNDWSVMRTQQGKVAERIQAFQALEALAHENGGAIAYAAADLTNFEQIQQTCQQWQTEWQCHLNGVIHLAGVAPDRWLMEETAETFAKTLEPKVIGTWVLHQLMQQQPEYLFIGFSSLISFFGGATVGGYSAANNFLDSFSLYQHHHKARQSYCFGSSTWDDLGVSKGYQGKEATRAQGHYAMSVQQGLETLLAAVYRQQPHVLVGLEGTSHHIEPLTVGNPYGKQALKIWYTADANAVQLERLGLSDRYGVSVPCQLHKLDEMPLTETGEIDRDALLNQKTQPIVPPRNELERQLADIWQAVLGVSELGVCDNFFELGGNSLLAIQLFGKIEQVFGKSFPLATLFEAPTIEQLAQALQPDQVAGPRDSLVTIKAGGTQPPLFFVHDADGETILYLNLAQRLGSNRPVYGLRPYSGEDLPVAHTRIDEMVSYYIEKIRSVQPHGPYFLGGLCAGGALAQAIAVELQAQGETVPLVVLLDAADMREKKDGNYASQQRWQRLAAVTKEAQVGSSQGKHPLQPLVKLSIIAGKVVKKGKNFLTYQTQRRVKSLTRNTKVRLLRYYLARQQAVPAFLRGITIRDVYRFAAKEYQPQPYEGELVLFRATEKLVVNQPGIDDEPFIHVYKDPLFGWGDRATQGVKVFDVPGGHSSMLQEPYVEAIAKQLSPYLQATDAQ